MSEAYYNEINLVAAKWLENLIKAGHIARGVVDTRSIEDVRPSELTGYTQCHFFAGIGVWSYALRRAGWDDERPVWTGSCPCQPYSQAGEGLGFADERHLWPAMFHLLSEHVKWLRRQKRPVPAVLGEQVASKDADAWIDLVQADMESLGYAFGAIAFPSAGVGAPHIRDRTYWVADANGARPLPGAHARVHRGKSGAGARYGEPQRQGAAGGMANTDGGNAGTERQQRSGEQRQQPEDRGIVRVGYADGESAGRNGRGAHCPEAQIHGAHACDGDGPGHAGIDVRQLAHPDQHGCGTSAGPELHDSEHNAESCGSVRGLADSHSIAGGQGCALDGRRDPGSDAQPWPGPGGNGVTRIERPGPTNGFWRDADWLGCTDGKWRPVEPGSFPLVDGLAAGMGALSAGQRRLAEVAGLDAASLKRAKAYRPGSLRGYGNAINAHAARVWIECVLESIQK